MAYESDVGGGMATDVFLASTTLVATAAALGFGV